MTQGRGLYWSKVVATCEGATAGRQFLQRLVSLDGSGDERIAALLNENTLQPEGRGTRLTTRIVDELAGEADMFRSFMATAILCDFERVGRLLDPPRSTTSPSGSKRAPVRKSAVTRA